MNSGRLISLAAFAQLAVGCALGPAAARADPATIILPGPRAFPESIAATSDGTIYVGSLASGGIVRVRPHSSRAETWIAPGAGNTRSIFGVLADERKGLLWACSNDLSKLGIPGPGRARGSSLKTFDLATGTLRSSVPLPHNPSICNDIAIGPDGSAYITNTAQPEILRLRPGRRHLEVWLTTPAFMPPKNGGGLDGIAFGSDGALYVNTYSQSRLFRIEMHGDAPGALTLLQSSRPLVLTDAIRPMRDGSFLLVEGGGRLDRMVVHGNAAEVTTLLDGLETPTGVALRGHTAWVSEGQLSILLNPARRGQTPRLPFRVVPVQLPAEVQAP